MFCCFNNAYKFNPHAFDWRLARKRSIAPLFDTRLFPRRHEMAYSTMAERSRAGLSPEPIEVVALG